MTNRPITLSPGARAKMNPAIATKVTIASEGASVEKALNREAPLSEIIALLVDSAEELRLHKPGLGYELTVTGGKGEPRLSIRHYLPSRSERLAAAQHAAHVRAI